MQRGKKITNNQEKNQSIVTEKNRDLDDRINIEMLK